jgi:hypothetical protein
MGISSVRGSSRNCAGYSGRQGGSMRYFGFITAMAALIVFGVGPLTAVNAESLAGTASGTLTINGKAIPLKYSYAMIQPNTFDPGKNDTAVLLTEEPLPEGALSGIGDLSEATRNCHDWAYFKINSSGKPIYERIDHPSIKGGKYSQIQMSGFTHADFVSRKAGKDRVEGSFATSKPEDFMTYQYEIKVDFSTPLLRAKLPEPLLDAKMGKALPADGGEPGRAYQAYRKAAKDKDIQTFRRVAPQTKDMSDSVLKDAMDFMDTVAPATPKISRGYVKGDRAVLYLEGVVEGAKCYGAVKLGTTGKAWYVVDESWSDKPPKR